MIVAAVDLGSNTTRLLVGRVEDGKVDELHREIADHAARRGRRLASPPPPAADSAGAQRAHRLPAHGRVPRRRADAARRDERGARRGERRGVPRRDRVELRLRDAAALGRGGGGADPARRRRARGGDAPGRHRRRLDRARPRRLPDEPAGWAPCASPSATARTRRRASMLRACFCPSSAGRRPRSAWRRRSRASPRSTSASMSTTAPACTDTSSPATGRGRNSSVSRPCRSTSAGAVPALEPERAPVIVAGAAILVAILDAYGLDVDPRHRARPSRRRRARRGGAAGAGRGRRPSRRLHLLLGPVAATDT